MNGFDAYTCTIARGGQRRYFHNGQRISKQQLDAEYPTFDHKRNCLRTAQRAKLIRSFSKHNVYHLTNAYGQEDEHTSTEYHAAASEGCTQLQSDVEALRQYRVIAEEDAANMQATITQLQSQIAEMQQTHEKRVQQLLREIEDMRGYANEQQVVFETERASAAAAGKLANELRAQLVEAQKAAKRAPTVAAVETKCPECKTSALCTYSETDRKAFAEQLATLVQLTQELMNDLVSVTKGSTPSEVVQQKAQQLRAIASGLPKLEPALYNNEGCPKCEDKCAAKDEALAQLTQLRDECIAKTQTLEAQLSVATNEVKHQEEAACEQKCNSLLAKQYEELSQQSKVMIENLQTQLRDELAAGQSTKQELQQLQQAIKQAQTLEDESKQNIAKIAELEARLAEMKTSSEQIGDVCLVSDSNARTCLQKIRTKFANLAGLLIDEQGQLEAILTSGGKLIVVPDTYDVPVDDTIVTSSVPVQLIDSATGEVSTSNIVAIKAKALSDMIVQSAANTDVQLVTNGIELAAPEQVREVRKSILLNSNGETIKRGTRSTRTNKKVSFK